MSPAYRPGDRVLVSPSEPVKTGDRIVVKMRTGEVMVRELMLLTQTKIGLRAVNPDYEDREFKRRDIDWTARIIGVTQ